MMGADVSTAEAESLTPVINEFAFHFFKSVGSSQDGNIVFSPAVIATGLALLHSGSKKETASQISRVVNFEQFEKSDLDTAMVALRALFFEAGHTYQFFGASRIYSPKNIKISKKFRKSALDSYKTVVEGHSLEDPKSSAQEMNHWVSEAMAHTVTKDVVAENQLDHSDKLILLNALYFKGSFAVPFHRAMTKVGKFFTSETENYNVAMMNVKNSFPYFHDEEMKCQVVEMPYAELHYRVILILPDERTGLSELESRLTVKRLQKWCRPREMEVVDIHVPRFDISQTMIANETLHKMGIELLFDPETADLSNIGNHLCLSKFVHYARADVKEETAESEQPPGDVHGFVVSFKTFKADHPFLFLIQDKRKGAIAFMGRQTAPPKIDPEELKEIYKRAKSKLRAKATEN